MQFLTAGIFILLAAFSAWTEVSSAQESSVEQTQKPQAVVDDYGYDGFLRRVGFEDFSEGLRDSLRKKNFLNPHISKRVLEYQSERLEMYNDVRRIAVEVLNTLHTVNKSPQARDKMVEFAARLVSMKPLKPELDERFENDPDAAADDLMEKTRDLIEIQSELLMSDLITVLYGKERINAVLDLLEKNLNYEQLDEVSKMEVTRLNHLQIKVNHLIQFMYLDNEMGGFSVAALGKALILGMTRYQILKDKSGKITNKATDLIAKMKLKLKSFHQHYENYVGTRLFVESEDGLKFVDIFNGSFIFERSFGQQANEITAGSRPGGIRNWLYAARLNLLGLILGRTFHSDTDEVPTNPNLWERVKKKIRESKILTNGVSHAGMAEILTDPETGIQTTRSWDAYLDDLLGGLRVTDILLQFSRMSEYLRLVVATPDTKKLAKYSQKYVNDVGYQDVIWMGDKENKDGSVHKKDSVPWPSNITHEEFEKLHTLAKTNPTAYSEEIRRRGVQGMKNLFYKGAAFASGFSNFFGRVFCTFALYVSWMQETGLDPQPVHDRWNFLVNFAKKMNVEKLKNLDMDHRTFAPAGFASQTELYDLNDIQVVNYPRMNTEEMLKESFGRHRTAMNPEIHRRLRTFGPFVKGTQPGAEKAARETLLVTRIEDAFTIERSYDKYDNVDHRNGRARSSYLGHVGTIIRRAARPVPVVNASSSKTQKPTQEAELSCSKVFKR